ncbi:MAG: hypothetical protein QN122_12410 [Armatimonadota bacterium]|nr:hypothetical protein [Armatimonadota bacterium]
MARIPKRLYGPAQLSAVAETKYTVPANTKTLLRQVGVSNPSASPVDFTLSIGADAAGTRLFDGLPIPADSKQTFHITETLEEGEIVQAFAGTANVLVLTLNGDEIVLG